MSEEAIGNGLIDVSALSLDEVDQIERPILRRAMQRILSDGDIGPVAGFSSSLQDEDTPQPADFGPSTQK